LRFTAPGDDLLCGTASSYEVRTADGPIDEKSFASATPVPVDSEPQRAGAAESLVLPPGVLRRYVAVRAVDEQGNVGRPAIADRAATSCRPAPLLGRARVRAVGSRLRIEIPPAAGPVRVDVFQHAKGRRVVDRLVARFRPRTKPFTWDGRANRPGGRVRDGILMVRLRAGSGVRSEKRRFSVRRRHGRLAVRPAYFRAARCRLVSKAKLLRSAFGGRRERPLRISFALTRPARVAVTVMRGGKAVRRFRPRTYRPHTLHRLSFGAARARRGNYRVRIVAIAEAASERVSLVARRV
jgi:hypothetical protein